MKWRKFLAILLVLSILCSLPITTALAADEDTEETEYELYPLPQEITYGTDNSNLPSTVNAYFGAGIDTYTVDRAEQALSHGGLTMNQVDAAENAQLIVEIYDADGTNNAIFGTTVDSTLFTKIDAYLLVIAGNKVGVLGKDTDAAFYGLTTLQQILDQTTGGVVRNLTIQDWADVASRGFIEGYYGNPWSTEDRAELMRWAGNFKLNSYFYAPKDDPKHNARWYERYTDEELEAKIKPLAEAGNASKCQFVYALHPFMSSAINQSNYSEKIEQLKAKFEQVMVAGVRQIAVLADDAGNQGNDLYIQLMTDLVNWVSSDEMQEKYPGLKTTIPFCPVQYGGNGESWMSGMPQEVPIVMTGGRIWGEVTDNFTNTFYNNVGRGPYMWINWPCTDNSKRHLIMGGYTTFLHPGVSPEKIQGIVLNPMQQSEPSKVAIFGNACYSWNIWTEDEADQAWEDSFKYVDHETYVETDASNALKEMSKHMINQNMDSRVTALQESVVLKDTLNAFKTKLSSGTLTTEDIETMRAEFQLLADASETYREAGNSRIVGQIVYWLDTWDDITAAADLLLNALDAYYVNNNAGIVPDYYTQAQAKLEAAETHGFWYVDHTEYAEVGVQHIMPFLRTVRDHVATLAQLTVDPTKVIATPVTNRENPTGSLSNVLDGNESTEVVYKNPNQIFVDDYIGVTYSRAIEIHDVKFVTGTTANPKDTFTNAVLEYTEDGTTWKQVPDVAEFIGNKAILEAHNLNLTAKGIRLRATIQRDNTWFGIREIYVNDLPEEEIPDSNAPLTGTVQKTSGYAVYEGPETKLTDGNDDTYVWYSTPGNASNINDYIGLDLGGVYSIGRVRVVVGHDGTSGDKWKEYHIAYSENGTTWEHLSSITGAETGKDIVEVDLQGARARYVRIINDAYKKVWCYFSEFQVYPYVEDHTEVICTGRWTVYQGSESNLLDGDDNTFIWYDPDGSGNTTGDDSLVGDYIGLDLGEVKQVGKVRFVIGHDGGDKWKKYHLEFTAEAELDFSSASEDWTTVQSFIGADSGKDVVEVNLGGVEARYVRMVNDEQCGCWIKFSEITVTEFDAAKDSAPYVFTNSTTAGVGAYGQKTEDRVTLSKALPITLAPGEYIGIALDRITHLSDITVNDNTDALTLKASANLDEMNAYTDGSVDARYVYLVNEGTDDVTFILGELALTIDEISGITLVGVEGLEVNQAYKDSDAELTGTYTNWFDGNVNTAAGFSRYQKTNGTITFDLGQSREITSVEALVQDSQINYIRKGVIEVAASLDGEWTSVVTIDKYAGNTYDDYTAGSVGWGEASSTYPNFRSYLGTLDEPVTARYLRIRITADYNYRFINLNEIIINGGEYVPSTSNPTFVADPPEVSEEYLPEFVADGNITTGFKPNMEGRESGSLIYKLSDKVEIDQINILQSSGAISNAEVYVRGVASTNALMSVSKAARVGEWVKLGTLTESLTSFYTYNFESIYEIKITWGNVSPLIYEIALIPRGVLAVDKTQLASLVEQCEEIVQQDESKYDATALSAYREARKAAQDILAGTVQSQAQVNEAYALLNSAHRALLNSVNDLATAKEQLTALKNSYQEEDYTSNSWSQFTGSDAYKNVATVLAGNNLTAIKAATQALLNEAEQTLQRRGDLTKLNELLASIEKLNGSDYTTESYEALQKVVEEAEALVEDADNATDAAIDAMVQKLTAAVENLERKPAPSRPGTSKYTLRFVTNGGSTLEAITAIKGTTIKLKDYVPIREGYTFAGWYLDADLTEKVTEVTLNASTSIYAKWTKNGMPFTDVKVGTWYYDAVAFVYENGLMQGTSATRFSPDSSLTRAMLAQILYNRAGKPTVKDKSAFTDVANDAWYADAVIWAYGEGIVSGVGGGKFAPDASITREQLAAMLYRAAGSPEVQETTLTFNDASKVSSYAKSAICWAVEEGIVTGKGGNRLDPTGTATRAEVAQMLARFEQS